MVGAHERLSLVEYGAPVDLAKSVAEITGLDRSRASQLLAEAGVRVATSLGFGSNPVSIDARGVRALDFAGLIRLSPALELEVAPKFLGDAHPNWREDFFFLSTLSKHGRLLATERLSAAGGAPRDLATLVARSLTGMYEARKRRPLRSYRRVKEVDFFVDDDPDPVDLRFPGPDGFEQEVVKFDRRNPWNAAMREAAKELLAEVGDPDASSALLRMVEDLAPQHWTGATSRKRIPARHRAWKPVHELSLDVLSGLGINYKLGRAHAPGYVVSTWQVWEDLLTVAARLGFGSGAVRDQKGVKLGTKHLPSGLSSAVNVFPDLLITPGGGAARFVLDAKYKGHIEKDPLKTKESDIYEAMAFAKATNCPIVVLAYPAPPLAAPLPPGSCEIFETVVIDQLRIVSTYVEARDIAKPGALRQFAQNLRSFLLAATK
ncbi:MAG: 5-methylcytosine restriction system specificity protein McrC [Ramlibacter sp.]